jgi:hypothetical protein
MALAIAHMLAEGKPNAILFICPSHTAKKWTREAIKTIPFARTFLNRSANDTYLQNRYFDHKIPAWQKTLNIATFSPELLRS